MTTYDGDRRLAPRSRAARPILAEVARTIADVQVRNRGTIGGNVCSNDPTNHFPPLLAALGAELTIRGAERRAHGRRRRVLRGRLPDRRPPGRAARRRVPHPGEGRRPRRLGLDHARQGRHRDRQRRRDRLRRHRADRDRLRRRDAGRRHRERRRDRGAGRRPRAPSSTHPPTSTPPPTTGATSPRCSPPAR